MSVAPQPHFGIQDCVHLLPCCAHFGDDDTHRGHGFDVVAVEITGRWKHCAKLIVALHQFKETNFVGCSCCFSVLALGRLDRRQRIRMPAADPQIEHLLQQPQCGLVAMDMVGGSDRCRPRRSNMAGSPRLSNADCRTADDSWRTSRRATNPRQHVSTCSLRPLSSARVCAIASSSASRSFFSIVMSKRHFFIVRNLRWRAAGIVGCPRLW